MFARAFTSTMQQLFMYLRKPLWSCVLFMVVSSDSDSSNILVRLGTAAETNCV